MRGLFLFSVLLIGCLELCLGEWKIDYITPHHGSLNGGTQVTVFGSGFDTNVTLDYENPRKRLSFANDLQSYECIVNIEASDENQVVCETSPMPLGYNYIRMWQDGEYLPDNKYCGGYNKAYNCNLYVGYFRTPSINALSWRTGEVGQQLTVNGRIFTNKISANEETSSSGLTAAITRVYVGGDSCSLLDETNNGLPYGVYLNDDGESQYGNFTCLMLGSLVGYQNVSYLVNENFGRSLTDATLFHVGANNQTYNLQTYAVVTGVSPNEGSLAGGTELTITGRGFYNDLFSPAEVYVGGANCEVTSVTDTEIKCLTPEQPEIKPAYSGSRGTLIEVYRGFTDAATAFESTPDHTFFSDSTNPSFEEGQDFVFRSRGFFIPSLTDQYFFILQSSAQMRLYVNPNGNDPQGATENVTTSGSQEAYSDLFSFNMGQEYYYELQVEGGAVDTSYRLEVFFSKALYTSAESGLSRTERQTVAISAPVVKEIQTLSFENWASESAVETVFSLAVDCLASSCDGTQFFFNLFETNSDYVEYSSSLNNLNIQTRLNSMTVLGSDTVEVTDSGNNTFSITFKSSRGHMPLMVTSLSTDLQVELTVVTTGKPSLESFTFTVNGKVSPSVDYDGSANDVKAAVTSLFGPICPPEVESSIGTAISNGYYDMEDDRVPSGSKTTDESYCGLFSVKNPSYLYYDEVNSYSAQTAPQICFAYKGSLSSSVTIVYSYLAQNEEGAFVQSTTTSSISYSTEITTSNVWKHVCLNVFEKLEADQPGGLSYRVQRVSVSRVSYLDDLYLDNIFIGDSSQSNQQLETFVHQIIPSAVEHIKVESIAVVKTDNAYEITYNPIDCGFNFPLLGIAFGTVTSSENNHTQYAVGEGSATIHVYRNSTASHPISGNFQLSFTDSEIGTLEDIPFNVSASELKYRFESLGQINEVTVNRRGSCEGYSWDIGFVSPGGNYPSLIATSTSLDSEPGPISITPTTTVQGGTRMRPIFGDFLRTAHDAPQVQVNIHGIPSACLGPDGSNTFDQCNFQWTASSTPALSGVSSGSSEVLPGDVLTIDGTDFSLTSSENNVLIGGVACVVTSSTTTSITCTVGDSPEGQQSLTVSVSGKGKATDDSNIVVTVGSTAGNDLSFSSSCSVSSVNPEALQVPGGLVTVTGTGFEASFTVLIDNSITVNTNFEDATSLQFTSPVLSPGTHSVEVATSDGTVCSRTQAMNVVYEDFTITQISPSTGSLAGNTEVKVTGSGLHSQMKIQDGHGNTMMLTNVNADGTEATFITASSSTTHLIQNSGRHSTYGFSYAWNPADLTIQLHDDVNFVWSQKNFIDNPLSFGVFTVNKIPVQFPFSSDRDIFNLPSGESGNYTVSLNTAGTYLFVTGCLVESDDGSDNCILSMPGKIEVESTTTLERNLSFSYDGYSKSSSVPFTYSYDDTPRVTDISPKEAQVDDTIQFSGVSLDTIAEVRIGGKECSLDQSASATAISCSIAASEELAPGYHEVVIAGTSKGTALIQILPVSDQLFRLLPKVTGISRTCGSTEGNTTVDIQGTGFNSGVTLKSAQSCITVTTTYTRITCMTQQGTAGTTIDFQLEFQGADVSSDSLLFEYSDSCTPEVSSFTYQDSITIAGTTGNTDFSAEADKFTLRAVGTFITYELTPTSVDGNLQFEIPDTLVAGRYDVSLLHSDYGLARFSNGVDQHFTKDFVLSSVHPTSGSVQGGSNVTLIGNGFEKTQTKVFIGDVECMISQFTSDFELVCVTAPITTPGNIAVEVKIGEDSYSTAETFNYDPNQTPEILSITPSQGSSSDQITIAVSDFSETSYIDWIFLDDQLCTALDSDTWTNQISLQLCPSKAGEHLIKVRAVDFGFSETQTFTYELKLDSVSPTQGSFGGGQTVTLNGDGFSEDMTVQVCGQECKLESTSDSSPLTFECVIPSRADLNVAEQECDVVVTSGSMTATLSSAYTYRTDLTCYVTELSRTRGGTGGGSEITITGTNFFSSVGTTVTLDGSSCIIKSSSATEIVCETEPHNGPIIASVDITCGSNGLAVVQDGLTFEYVDLWSSVFTWGGESVPENGSLVVIQNHTIVLDTETNLIKMLLIDGGTLKVTNSEDNVVLNAENILIVNGGTLQIGTEEEPFLNKAEIIMHGNLRSPELPIYGAKTLGVRKGTLEFHGKHIVNPWSLLDATASAGSTTITVQHNVSDWNAGDKIVIASTGTRHSQKENEERTITQVSADGFTLTLNQPLDFTHLGETRSVFDTTVEYRAEVGLLSRNIVFRGSDDPQWHDDIPACGSDFKTGQFSIQTCFQGRFGEETGSDEFGASIMIHSVTPATAESSDISVRIENLEITYAGQAFRLGRYPIHWHLMGDMTGNYVKNCAIHKTFNRAVTIHGTHNLLVERNVIYNVKGGGVFIEDGIETGNIIQYNLAVFVIQSTSLLTEDITPAAFWVTNPNNTIRHNHGAGGTHFCVWYRMNEHPDGPSFTSSVCQQKVELGEFRNNTCHSQGWFGLWIFPTYFPAEGGSCGSTVPSAAKFHSLTTWHCEKGAEWVNCGPMQFHNFVLTDNEKNGLDLKLVSNSPNDPDNGALVKDTIISGRTSGSNSQTGIGVAYPMSGNMRFENLRIENFDANSPAFEITTIQGKCTSLCGGYEISFKNIELNNVEVANKFSWKHEVVFIDEDGSLSGTGIRTLIVPKTDIFDPTQCQEQTGSRFSSGLPASFCDGDVTFNRLALNQALPSSLEANDLYVKNQFGNTSSLYAKKRLSHAEGWMLLLQSKQHYVMWWEDGEQFTNLSYSSAFFNFREGDYVLMTHELPQTIDRVAFNEIERDPLSSIDENNKFPDYSYDIETKNMTYIVAFNSSGSTFPPYAPTVSDSLEHYTVSPRIYRCKNTACVDSTEVENVDPNLSTPGNTFLWSDENSACRKNCTVPQTSDEDGSLCWVIVDTNITGCTDIVVDGILEVRASAGYIVIQAQTIIVNGRFIAGYENASYTGKLDLVLSGNHSTPGKVFQSSFLGSKAIGVRGGLDLHGQSPGVHWTSLNQTANVGDNEIVLEEEVDWKVGDEIVITTTGYRSQETETRVITSISSDKKTLSFSSGLEYRHLSVDGSVEGRPYSMKAEVGVLTRNIRIIGEDYDEINDQAFGARVLVTSDFVGTTSFRGWARVANVEFNRTGQEGWTESYDPRFSLTWLNTGETSGDFPSYAKQNAFHNGFSTAIGTFGASGIEISDNVVHRTIHDGIRITGANHVLRRNLVTMSLFRGAWDDRFEITNFKDWHACFEISQAENLTLEGNVAAGSERLGFHTDGEACGASEENAWKDNVAHGCLHGLHIFVNDGVGDCSMLRNFLVYKSWDYGVYFQTPVSVVVRNTVVVDSVVSFMPIIIGPTSLSHAYADKLIKFENVSCVGKSNTFDSQFDFMDEQNDKNLKIRSSGPDRAAPRVDKVGSSCIVLPIFASKSNSAPFKGFHFQISYPAILGSFIVDGLHVSDYGNAKGPTDYVYWIDPKNEDAHHPTVTLRTKYTDVNPANKFRLDRPSRGKVNPSDCVDMICDGKKIIFIKDLDGSFLGEIGTVVSESQYSWDIDPVLGIGDYRIPKTFLTTPENIRLDPNVVVPNKGIIGTANCTLNENWLAFECNGGSLLDYRMLVIESMDSDTETRRLSPVAIIGDQYVELINGPQDHGWCFGYTCQKRISTFWVVVANDKTFEIYFTGYAPEHLRLRIILSSSASANGISDLPEISPLNINVKIFYARPERFDVHLPETSDLYIYPANSQVDSSDWILNENIVLTDHHGENYFDTQTQLLYVHLSEESPVDIKKAPAIIISLKLPAIGIDEFFGDNLVQNLATYLGIPSDKIRTVDIKRETSSRRKRSVSNDDTVTYTLMYTDPYDASIDPNDPVAIEAMNNVSQAIVLAHQTDVLSDVINSTILEVTATQVDRNLTGEVINGFNVVYTIPTTLSISSFPATVEEQMEFPNSIVVIMKDADGNAVNTVGNMFEVTVTLNTSITGANPSATLLGNTNMMFDNGTATFSNLMISHEGTYQLNFQITQPVNVQVSSTMLPSIVVTQRTVNLGFNSATPSIVYHGNEIPLNLQLQDSALQPLQNVGYKGHTWKLEVTLVDSNASLGTTDTFTFNSDGLVTTTGLNLMNTISSFQYILRCRAYTEPALYDISIDTDAITFYSEEEYSSSSNFVVIEVVSLNIAGQPYQSRTATSSLNSFTANVFNQIAAELDTTQTRTQNGQGNSTEDGNTQLTFNSMSTDSESQERSLQKMESLFNGSSNSATFNGEALRFADFSCGLQVNGECRGTTPSANVVAVSSNVEDQTYIFVIVGVVVAAVLAALIIAFACVMKRAKLSKVGLMNGKCVDASSSRGSSPLMDSFNGTTPGNTPGAASQMGSYPRWDERMTPVQN